MNEEYSYPIDYTLFTKDEVIVIIKFLDLLEKASKTNVDKDKIVSLYRKYQRCVNSKTIEKQIDRDFLKVSGVSVYKVMKQYI